MRALRRLIPRFSLRTLAIFLLLATSGMGLWWHWDAWFKEWELTNDAGHIRSVAFSADDSLLAVASYGEASPALR